MRATPTHRPPQILPSLRWLGLAAGLALVLSAQAAPGAEATTKPLATDPLTRLLSDRGLLEPLAHPQALMRSMRDRASDLVIAAMNFLDVPYHYGGNTAETGFDCSGFTRFLFAQRLGLDLPRRADEQAEAPGLAPVERPELQPGDLVFFNTLRRVNSHVGIYVGDGKFIHAPRTGALVRIESLRSKYWSRRFTAARRAEPAGRPAGG